MVTSVAIANSACKQDGKDGRLQYGSGNSAAEPVHL